MRGLFLGLVLVLMLARPAPTAAGQGFAEAVQRITACEAAIRAGVRALSAVPYEVAAAIVAPWDASTAAQLGVPTDCVLPPSAPTPYGLEGGGWTWCLWWQPLTTPDGLVDVEATGAGWECPLTA